MRAVGMQPRGERRELLEVAGPGTEVGTVGVDSHVGA
jgi:hypothetical protein